MCNNENCCLHGRCAREGHDVKSVMGHGFGSMCIRCGEVGLPLPAFEDASLTQKLAGLYKKDK